MMHSIQYLQHHQHGLPVDPVFPDPTWPPSTDLVCTWLSTNGCVAIPACTIFLNIFGGNDGAHFLISPHLTSSTTTTLSSFSSSSTSIPITSLSSPAMISSASESSWNSSCVIWPARSSVSFSPTLLSHLATHVIFSCTIHSASSQALASTSALTRQATLGMRQAAHGTHNSSATTSKALVASSTIWSTILSFAPLETPLYTTYGCVNRWPMAFFNNLPGISENHEPRPRNHSFPLEEWEGFGFVHAGMWWWLGRRWTCSYWMGFGRFCDVGVVGVKEKEFNRLHNVIMVWISDLT